ncbi:MAG: hypothetical protein KJ069_25765 [Anaerolineae bacterium]|nr:hypothetical protein [Anaerolineae bacterium]
MDEQILIQAETYHNEAMELADDAFLAKTRNDLAAYLDLLTRAISREIEAAELIPIDNEYEPSRSILFRSAANMAYEAEEYRLADRLVAAGLSGFPPPDVETELKNLYENINFMRNLENANKELADDGFFFAIEGEDTFFGGVLINQVTDRLKDLQAIFYHTIARMIGLEFGQEKLTAAIKDEYSMYLEAQFAGSYGVLVKIGKPKNQLSLFPDFPELQESAKPIVVPDLIKEILDCLELWERADVDELRERIDDRKYFENFVAVAKKMAPDGRSIKTVAISSSPDIKDRPVFLRKSKKIWSELMRKGLLPPTDIDTTSTRFILRGFLRHAHTPKTGEYGTVKLDDFETRKTITIRVPMTYMKDTVQPHYEEEVQVVGYIQNGTYYLDDIDKLNEI